MSTKALPNRPHDRRGTADCPYALQDLLRDVPLAVGEDEITAHVTCVDFWDGNLYVGGSNGELLHFVSIPGESDTDPPTFILASRQEPIFNAVADASNLPGVQQILVLPSAKKACVVCNGTLTFYTLPELSPAYDGKVKVGDCQWVGGLDESREYGEDEEVTIILCLKQRLRLIRLGEQARRVRNIELPGIVTVRRRGDLACVADNKTYSLIDVVNQQKNDLFPISSAPVTPPRSPAASEWPSPYQAPTPTRSDSRPRPLSMQLPPVSSPIRQPPGRTHERVVSLGSSTPATMDRLRPESPSQWPARASSRLSVEQADSPSRDRSPAEGGSRTPPTLETVEEPERPAPAPKPLKPIILSPSPSEFLLATGTSTSEPGVGMFVNEDGDVSRGTIEFSSYPKDLLLDSTELMEDGGQTPGGSTTAESYVLALLAGEDGRTFTLEIQRIDGDEEDRKSSLALPQQDASTIGPGIGRSTSTNVIATPGMIQSLALRKLRPLAESTTGGETDERRNAQEDQLIQRFASNTTRCVFFSGSHIWWLVRHPLIISLNSRLEAALEYAGPSIIISVQRQKAEQVFNDLRGKDPQDEIQFMTYNYVRQKAALILFLDLMKQTEAGKVASTRDILFAQDALITSDVDPRIVLLLVPTLRQEVLEAPSGTWVPGGLKVLVEAIQKTEEKAEIATITPAYRSNILTVIKTLLMSWRKKKGFGSVSDESYVFQTVDAALLHVLLILDTQSPRGPATPGSLRAELNEVMDRGVDCFDRAVQLLEQHHRLYLLSRLYQNKKMTSLVLATWRRVVEGEEDRGGELLDGEADIRKYLGRIKDTALVREYGTWLANRNPLLGVQIFADDNSRVKFSMTEAVDLLKAKAPNAVRYYLEYLVFAKNQPQYSEQLIKFYLDGLLEDLADPESEANEMLKNVNEIYSTMPPPKATYMQFITDNAPEAEWYQRRMRLLQLLETTPPRSKLDYSAIVSRLSPHASLLVPESIILHARLAEHEEALHLLVHTLGDFDTAIRYCVRAGSRIFQPARLDDPPPPPDTRQNPLLDILLQECMALPDEAALDRSAELLQRFGTRFDLAAVLPRVPPEWPVVVMQGFLDAALRSLTAEKRESAVLKGLAASQNLRVAVEQVELLEKQKVLIQEKGEPGAASWADSGYGTSVGTGNAGED